MDRPVDCAAAAELDRPRRGDRAAAIRRDLREHPEGRTVLDLRYLWDPRTPSKRAMVQCLHCLYRMVVGTNGRRRDLVQMVGVRESGTRPLTLWVLTSAGREYDD